MNRVMLSQNPNFGARAGAEVRRPSSRPTTPHSTTEVLELSSTSRMSFFMFGPLGTEPR
jgi:hypothetical protein